MKTPILVLALFSSVTPALADESSQTSAIDKAITDYDAIILVEDRKLIEDLQSQKQRAQEQGDLERLQSIEREIDAFLKDGSLPKAISPGARRIYTRNTNRAKTILERAYRDEIVSLTKQGKIDLAVALKEEFETFLKEGRKANSIKLFANGDAFAGPRTTWDGNVRPFRIVIETVKDNAISGYAVRPTENDGLTKLTLQGTVDGNKISFKTKGLPNTVFALVELEYQGQLTGNELHLDFAGKGGRGESGRKGKATLVRETVQKSP